MYHQGDLLLIATLYLLTLDPIITTSDTYSHDGLRITDMTTVAYQRVSSDDQNLDRQDDLQADKYFVEKVSGSTRDRPALNDLLSYIREGDTIVVHSIDRLARDLRDLQNIIHDILNKSCSIKFISEGLSFSADTDNPFAQLQLQMMGAFAQFERTMIRKRQAEGIAKAKAKGVYKGTKPSVDRIKVKELLDEGLNPTKVARRMNISRVSVYRIKNELGI